MPQQRKEKSDGLRGGGDQINSIDLGFERWQIVTSTHVNIPVLYIARHNMPQSGPHLLIFCCMKYVRWTCSKHGR